MWFLQCDSLSEVLIGVAVRVFIIFAILPIHEYAHAKAAYKLGDSTAKLNGRMTLNPLAHIDWLGAACIMLIGFGWAKPVPVNPYNFNNRDKMKRGMALTALAGPMSNLIVALIGLIVFRFLYSFEAVARWDNFESGYILQYAFLWLVLINIGLAVFNLIPVPPLDGSKIFAAFIPDKYLRSIETFVSRYRMVIFIALIVLVNIGVLDRPLSWLQTNIFSGLLSAVDWLFDLVGLGVGSIG